jgi:DNA repair protein RecO (recombination protein O)
MEWSDDAIVLSTRPHGETGAILELLTAAHGRHLGLVRGGAGSRMRPVLQPGNRLHVQWRARLAEHLGSFTAELARPRAGELMDSRARLAGLNAFAAVSRAALPEREAHGDVFAGGEILLDAMVAEDEGHWLPLYVRWEAGLLESLGFGLDLSQCVVTGQTEDLTHVSPRSGRAVSQGAGEPYAARLLVLPEFLLGSAAAVPDAAAIRAGLRLTGHFLAERVLRPNGQAIPPARLRLEGVADRLDESA